MFRNGRPKETISPQSYSDDNPPPLSGEAPDSGHQDAEETEPKSAQVTPLPIPRTFDEDWYRLTYPDVGRTGLSPYEHFRAIGENEAYRPNKFFDVAWYLRNYPDVAEVDICPLAHYEDYGWKEGRNPSASFDTQKYQDEHPESALYPAGPLQHFLDTWQHDQLYHNHLKVDMVPGSWNHSILMICYHAPTIMHAGGLRIADIIKQIKERNPKTYIEVFAPNNTGLYGHPSEVSLMADKIIFAENYNFSVSEYIKKSGDLRYFDVIDFQFAQPLNTIKEYTSIGKEIIFTPMESLIRTECIQDDREWKKYIELRLDSAVLEAEICEKVDRVICVSEADKECIQKTLEAENIMAIETGVSDIEFGNPPNTSKEKNSVCYLAYFGSETNRVALSWYLKEVHLKVLEKFGEYDFRIVGRGDISEILEGVDSCVTHVGEVKRIAPEISRACIGIAPALSGAGFRGKINQYATMGVPTVATTIAAKGFAYSHGTSILIADKAEEFASHIVGLLSDPSKQSQIGRAAAEICEETYSWGSRWPQIASAYALPTPRETLWLPTIHAIVPSYRHGSFIEERIRSIFNQTYGNIRVTIIDDCSPDDSDQTIRDLQDEFDFDYIRNKKNSGSPFSAWEFAAQNTQEDLVWICESDDYCDHTMVARLINQMRSHPDIKLSYCASRIVNESGALVETTAAYHHAVFHPTRWNNSFVARGNLELLEFQRRGMVVPNMSSILIDTDVFRAAFTSSIKKYHLAGDWLFIGQAMQNGRIAYLPDTLNCFRKHSETARVGTKIARQMAEYISVRLILSQLAGVSEFEMMDAIKTDLFDLYGKPNLEASVLRHLQDLDGASHEIFIDLYDRHCRPGLSAMLKVALSNKNLRFRR